MEKQHNNKQQEKAKKLAEKLRENLQRRKIQVKNSENSSLNKKK
jgi:hypothetical protein